MEDVNTSIEKELPEVIYKKAKNKKRKNLLIGLACLMIIEASLAVVLVSEIVADNIQVRVLRELEYFFTSKIQLDSGVYTGDLDFGLFDGMGEFVFDTGAVYEGEWQNDVINGLGELNIPKEGVYAGDFVYGKKQGKGVFTWDDGDIYDGEWLEDEMSGQGIYTASGGVVYKGTFANNAFKKGECKFENETGEYVILFDNSKIKSAEIVYADGTKYKGACEINGVTGSGEMTFANEDKYVGELENDKRMGQGVYTWQSGASYDGDWLYDYMSGIGTYTYSEDNYATGTFDKNIFIEGTYHFVNDIGEYDFSIEDGEPVSVKMTLQNGIVYSGGVSDGKLNGDAHIKYSNGDIYDGWIVDNKKSGQGKYRWASGASYDGHWSDDKMDGSGTYIYPESVKGFKLVGDFEDGRPNGSCDYYVSASESYNTDWVNGRCVKVYE